ncbi:MAG TPA: (2Fe-2S)-binding protein [Mycobacterium sp.]|nr:(2Fe-2S)-binding protein [Mycobacterium sp.]HUH69250.1 (2Fe-2S)-binding protein [Mycobacterium sp.]
MTKLMGDNGLLAARVEAVRTALAQRAARQPANVEIRVAASVAHFGLIARLLAPAIGMITLGYTPASLSLDDLWWQNELGRPYPLSITPRSTTQVPGAGPAVEAITAAIAEGYAVSHRVLWGNIGSAANSAAQLIATTRADLTRSARAAADAILTDPRIEGGALRAGPLFRRRSCCLIYRLAHDRAAVCGDCVLGSGLRVAYDSP